MDLNITLLQTSILWENKAGNLEHIQPWVASCAGKTDLVVLPEMFSTGFSMNCSHLAETTDGNTILTIKTWAEKYQLAFAGSFLSHNGAGKLLNRGFFITPNGHSYYYDKRHLFRMGEEDRDFIPGIHPLTVPYLGWNIRLIICYDLRFPVWIRNVNNAYDLLLCVGNWPESRIMVWDTLLKARALENQCYVCGVNRVGKDGSGIIHNGHSQVISPKGIILGECQPNQEEALTLSISKEELDAFRLKFPVWKDADRFEIEN